MGIRLGVNMKVLVCLGLLTITIFGVSAMKLEHRAATGCAKIPSWLKSAMTKAPAGDRVIGGSKAGGVLPWQVSIRRVYTGLGADMKPFKMIEHFCGGTILDAKTILSAAHCFPKGDQSPKEKEVMAGSVNVNDAKTSQSSALDKIVFNTKHPWASDTSSNNDIVIIKLKTALKFNDKVQPACLPDVAGFDKAQANKQMAVVSGWGGLKDGGDVPELLQFVPLPLFPNTMCGGFMDGGLSDGMICAGYSAGGKDPCQGDSGGPLVIGSSDDTAVIVGAVSHGMGKCGEKGKPAIYAKVTKYLDWIKENMEK